MTIRMSRDPGAVGGLLAVLMLLLFQEASGQPFQEKLLDLPPAQGSYAEGITHDWLIDSADTQAGVFRDEEGKALILSNGLIARTFRLAPNAATISLKKLKNQEELIRAVKPEAVVEITKDGPAHGPVTFCRHGSLPVPKSRIFSGSTTGAFMRRQAFD